MKDGIKRTMLLILDGWGKGQVASADALKQANTPFMDSLMVKYPNADLVTFGEKVGLPEGQMGNSEVGHLNLGAGRIVYQDFARINNEIAQGTFKDNEMLQHAIKTAEDENVSFHIMGLLSDGGVHSHINHLIAVCDILETSSIKDINIHAFTDGRDTAPNGGKDYVRILLEKIKNKKAKLATVIGRYYAMDRDNRWERIKKAYDVLVHGNGEYTSDVVKSIQAQYDEDISDEFLKPIVVTPTGNIKEGDVVLFINFRTDRPRQITTALSQENFPDQDMEKLNLHFYSMTQYDASFKGVNVLFNKENLTNTIGEVLEKAGKTQTRIAETEKYPHVTFFFNGGREEPFIDEERIMIPSPKVATYDLQPEMGAKEITQSIIENIKGVKPDFICLNYANTDMVGHTGIWDAAITAAECVDSCLAELVPIGLEHNYEIIIIADHGNSDFMINEDGTPHTAHTTNMVPIIYVSNENNKQIKEGKLGDVAPTLLSLMNVEIPEEMTGNILVS